MTRPAFHRFLDLDETERTAWIARFLDDPGSRTAPYDCPYPILRGGEQPFTWLIDQFRRVKWTEGLPGRIRRPVVDLIVTEGGRHGVKNRPQLLGELLEVAGACEFTEVTPALRAWIRDGRYRDDWYEILGGRKPVRLITWSILIGWREAEGLTDALLQDLERTDLACAQLCFAELGRQSPGEAIERIPVTLAWPEPYRREVLRRFLTSLGPRQAVSPRYQDHWKRCFAEILWTMEQNLSVVDEASFGKLLHDVGIVYERAGTLVHLRSEPGTSGIDVDVATSMKTPPRAVQGSDLIEEAYVRLWGAADPATAAEARKQLRALQRVEADEMRRRGQERSFLSQKSWKDLQRRFERVLG